LENEKSWNAYSVGPSKKNERKRERDDRGKCGGGDGGTRILDPGMKT